MGARQVARPGTAGQGNLLEIAERHGGAFLCDGVGLGKTFVGLMLLEYLIEHKRKRVALFVPKAARKPVWERALKDYAPHLRGAYSGLMIFNHTDLTRKGSDETDYPRLLADVKERADVVLIDEAHHFRNPGYAGTGRGGLRASGDRSPSRYHHLFKLIESARPASRASSRSTAAPRATGAKSSAASPRTTTARPAPNWRPKGWRKSAS